jgi:hypothetical protein
MMDPATLALIANLFTTPAPTVPPNASAFAIDTTTLPNYSTALPPPPKPDRFEPCQGTIHPVQGVPNGWLSVVTCPDSAVETDRNAVASSAYAQNTPEQNKVLYELQKECAKDADDFMDKVKAGKIKARLATSSLDKQDFFKLGHHYNDRLNRCFVEVVDRVYLLGRGLDHQIMSIWDVNNYDRGAVAEFNVSAALGGQGGQFKVGSCFAINPDDPDKFNDCAKINETISQYDFDFSPKWKALIKPYMQDSE